MKKILILFLLLLGAAGAAFYFTRSSSPVTTEYYADYLPQNTVATTSLIDLKGLSETFPATALGHFLAKPTVHAILTEMGVPPQGLKEYDDVYDGLAGVMTNPAFRQVFGDDAVVAVLPLNVDRFKTAPEKEAQNSLLVFGTSSVAGPLDSFASLVMSKNVSKETVDGLELTRIELDENEVMYGYAKGGVVLLAYAPGNIAQAVQQKAAGVGLQELDLFQTTKDYWAESAQGRIYTQSYINFAEIRSLLAASSDEQAKEFAKYLHGVEILSSVLAEDDDSLNTSSRMDYVFDELHPWVKDQYNAVSKENYSLGLLSNKALVYYWVSLLSKDYLNNILSVANEDQYKLIDAQVRKELGVSLDETMAAVGPQLGMVVNDVVNTGLFPLPKVVLFLEVRDHEIAQKLLDTLRARIAERGFAAEQNEKVNDKTIYYWSLLPGEATQLALVLTDNMLYLANGKAILKSLLESDYKPATLPASMAKTLGSELTQSLGKSNYTTVVVRPALLATQVREAINWVAGMLEATQGVTVEQLKKEIFKLMESVDIVAATSNVEQDHTLSTLVLKQAHAAGSTKK
jgi:hypothetical protein